MMAVMNAGLVRGGGGGPGYGNFKLRKVYYASSSRAGYYIIWNFIWTRADFHISRNIEWNDSAKMLGTADPTGTYTRMDEFGNTFRSFFVTCDAQDLQAAGFQLKTVRRNDNYFLNLFLLIISRPPINIRPEAKINQQQ